MHSDKQFSDVGGFPRPGDVKDHAAQEPAATKQCEQRTLAPGVERERARRKLAAG